MLLRVHKVELINNPIFGNFEINFTDEIDLELGYRAPDASRHGPYYSVIIGPNGTGKSNILKTLIEIFRELYSLQSKGERAYHIVGGFSIVYELDAVTYRFGNILYSEKTKEIIEIKNKKTSVGAWVLHTLDDIIGKPVAISELRFPFSILASSLLLTDKFPYLAEASFPQYKYLGVRSSQSTAGTRGYVRRTVRIISEAVENPFLGYMIERSLEYLDADKLYVNYKVLQYGKFFGSVVSADSFRQWYGPRPKELSNREEWYYNNLEKYEARNGFLEELASYCMRIANDTNHFRYSEDGKRTKYVRYDVSQFGDFQRDYIFIRALDELGILSFPSITIGKAKTEYDLTESSSGEYNFISSVLGLAASMKSNSLVLIDEPEISLHPNWQMKYFSFLTKVFSDFPNCHFIVCTHSHFLISDLPGKMSKILSIKRADHSETSVEGIYSSSPFIVQSIKAENTFGWSAEEVLLEVFNTPTTRNFYVSEKISEILELVSMKDRDEVVIRKKVRSLIDQNVFALSANDPLGGIWNKLVKKYG